MSIVKQSYEKCINSFGVIQAAYHLSTSLAIVSYHSIYKSLTYIAHIFICRHINFFRPRSRLFARLCPVVHSNDLTHIVASFNESCCTVNKITIKPTHVFTFCFQFSQFTLLLFLCLIRLIQLNSYASAEGASILNIAAVVVCIHLHFYQ